MDTDLLKTFLELQRTRHFGRAAENLFITQAAVSARIRQLEEVLGLQLFTRDRNNIRLTPAGGKFLQHAESIINTWNRALQDVRLADSQGVALAIGGVFSLWDILLQHWLHGLYASRPNIALRADAHSPETLLRLLLDGALDIGFMFEPPRIAELEVREFATLDLVLVSTYRDLTAQQALQRNDYLLVDWGTSFAISHARHFPAMAPPALHVGLGRIAQSFILEFGGSAYLARRMVAQQLAEQRLFLVADAPVISRTVYAGYRHADPRTQLLEEVLAAGPRSAAGPAGKAGQERSISREGSASCGENSSSSSSLRRRRRSK